MKLRILLVILIALHVFWIGTVTWADAAGTMKTALPTEVLISSIFLFIWVGYQAILWAQSALKAG